MRKPYLPAILSFTLLFIAALALWATGSATFTPPAQQGTIFAVINANRSPGATVTRITVQWGSFQRTVGRGNQYGLCSGPMSGWVLRVNNTRALSIPFTVSTTGTIARPPYQGAAPPEISHNCYKLETIRARF